MNYLIGVIVPVYKAERYVVLCIESILAQTYTNFRLILVDDGTPDNAGHICDEYAKKDQRITVIHQENLGVTRARARGVEEAEGCEFITFTDADDIMPCDALEVLVSLLKPGIDIVKGTLKRFCEEYPNFTNEQSSKQKVLSPAKYRKQMILGIESGPYCKLIRRSLLTESVFDIPRDIIMGEDCITNARIAFNNQHKVVTTTKTVYYYRQHEESIMHTFNEGVEYEEFFLKNLLNSIPQEELGKYRKFVVLRKIRTFDYHFGYSTQIPKWRGSNFYNTMIREIKEYHVKELLIERLLITTTNHNTRRILIFLKKAKNKLFGQDTLL